MNKVLENLKRLDLKQSTPNDVRRILKGMRLTPVLYTVKEGTLILRARSGKFYTQQSEMTYCPVEKCKSIQRASLPGNSMFYGAIPDDMTCLEKARAITLSESSKLAREGRNSYGREIITVSQWSVIKPLNVVSFITDNYFTNASTNRLLNDLVNNFNVIKESDRINHEELEIIRFISEEFSKIKKENDYLVTATLSTDAIRDLNIDGIIYPPVMLSGQGGLNIAITPEAVDCKLQFKNTIKQVFYKSLKEGLINIEGYSKDGEIHEGMSQYDTPSLLEILGISDLSELPWVIS